MTDYKFSEELNVRLVRGIEKGYSDYAEVRREKRDELLVSGAYAWVKGNHIEDQVARELKEIGIDLMFGYEYLISWSFGIDFFATSDLTTMIESVYDFAKAAS